MEYAIWVDGVLLALILVSAVIGLIRGFIRELLSIISWVVAIWVATLFAEPLSEVVQTVIESKTIAFAIALGGLFFTVLVVLTVVNTLMFQVVKSTGLSGTDRLVGILFGIFRGAILIAVLILVAKIFDYHQEAWWKASRVIVRMTPMADWIESYIPQDWRESSPQSSHDDADGRQ